MGNKKYIFSGETGTYVFGKRNPEEGDVLCLYNGFGPINPKKNQSSESGGDISRCLPVFCASTTTTLERINEVVYNKTKYFYPFTIEMLTDGTITYSGFYPDEFNGLYKINGGEWIRFDDSGLEVNLNAGDKLSLRCDCDNVGHFNYDKNMRYNVLGNIQSLCRSEKFDGDLDDDFFPSFSQFFKNNISVINAHDLVLPQKSVYSGLNEFFCGCINLVIAPEELPATTLANDCYGSMFNGCTSLTTAPELPATTLANDCYGSMFNGCTSLTTAPELPATTLTDGCYRQMFWGCTNLTASPALPATTLTNNCYNSMFYGCTSLTKAPELPATTLTDGCYKYMFYGCTSLTKAPALPATTLADSCYFSMFAGCGRLTKAPALPATTLADSCYFSMFEGCTSLTKAPALPATTLANYCYQNMFYGCRSLKTAPVLPATTLVYACYNYMFSGCWSLNYIKAMFTTTPGTSYTREWVKAAPSTGTFVKNASATWTTRGDNGIPTGWTIETASS